jgi:RHS repeat-associated protein
VVYSYDPVGRIASFWQCNPSNCGTLSIWNTEYNYDLAGDITSWVHPGGFKLTNTVNAAQQITAVQSSWQDSNHPQYLAQSISYTPWGAVSQLQNGCVGSGCTNAQETYTYNNRLQPWMIQVSGTSNGGYCLVYNYFSSWTPPSSCPSPSSVPTSGSGNNGNVMGYWYQDSVQSGFSHTASYTYDGVNRLSTAVATGTYSAYNLTFSYDPYGNMTCVTNGQTWGYCGNWAFNASTNQLTTSGFTYDAAGNLTKDSSNASAHTYQWDAEGQAASVDSGSTWKFTYNAVGDRVQWAARGGTQQQLFDPAGMSLGVVGMYSVVWSRNAPFALYLGGNTQFNHINNLGSTTLRTDQSGTAVEDMLFYPWGDVWQSWGGGGYTFAATPYDDVTTTTSPTMYRFYSMNLGRWHSPDPAGLAAANPANPQTWNLYAYATNNPTTLIDPTGLEDNGPCYGYYCASYGGPPPSSGPPQCWTSWCPGSNGGWVWNEPNPFGSQTAAAEGAYASWTNAMWLTGGTYTEWGTEGPVTYTIGWSITNGAFWIGPNGVALSDEAVQEAGLPVLAGPQIGTGIDLGALSTAVGIDYQRYQTMTTFKQISPLAVAKNGAVWYFCGSSPGGAVLNWMASGATKLGVAGALAGGTTGTLFGEVVGAPLGAALGGLTGATIGAGGGAIWGTAAAFVCSAAGAYGK